MTNAGPVPSVYFDKAVNKWHSRIYHKGRYIHVGRVGNRRQAVNKARAKIRELAQPREEPQSHLSWEERAAEAKRRIVGVAS